MQLTKHWAASLDDYVIDLAWSADGATLAAASAAGALSLFGAGDGGKLHVLPGHEDGANVVAWLPTSAAPATPLATPAVFSGAGTPSSAIAAAAATAPAWPAVQLLASGGQDGAVKFWDATSGQQSAALTLGTAWVEHLAWRPAGGDAPLLAAAVGRQLTFLRADASVVRTMPAAAKTISALAWHPQGGCVAEAHFGGVRLWDADDFVLQKELPYANGIHALVWSPDGRWLVSGNQDPSVHLWLPEQDDALHMSGYESKVRHLAFDRTSRWLATSGGRDACVWDCSGAGPEGREPAMLPHDAPVCALAFQHRHSLLATAAQDGVVMLWSLDRAQPLRATVRLPAEATRLVWSPDDALLAIGSRAGMVYVLRCVD